MPFEGLTKKDQKKHAALKEQVDSLFDGYVDLVASVFMNALSIDEMIATANAFFKNYQESNAQRIAVESVEDGNIDCTSAAIVCGIWWWLVSGLNPYYFVENELVYEAPRGGQYDTGSALAHSLVALPLFPDVTSQEVEAAYYALGGTKDSRGTLSDRVVFVEYRRTMAKDSYEFRKVNPHKVPLADMFARTEDFLKRQALRFGTKTSRKPANTEGATYEVVQGLSLDDKQLARKVRAAVMMGFGVEGDFADVQHVQVSDQMRTSQVAVKPTVLVNKATRKPITIFHTVPTA